ncbi:MAG: FG-GAP repeat domain-containing protein [Oligoflexus sp.]
MRSLLILSIFAIYAVFTGGCRGKDKSKPVPTNPTPTQNQELGENPSEAKEPEKPGQSFAGQAKLEFVAMADTNGDGRNDIVSFTDLGVFVSLSNGKGFLAPSLWTRDFAWEDQDRFPRLLGDVNGDKKADIVGFSRSNTVVAFSNGTSFGQMTVASNSFGFESADGNWASQNIYPRMLGFVNADPYIDIVACRASGCYVALSTGVNFQMPTRDPWIADFSTERDGFTSEDGWSSFDLFPRFLADVDGNGRTDIIGFGERGVWVSLAGQGKFEDKGVNAPQNDFFGVEQDWTRQTETPRLIGDIDGDGRADILGFDLDGNVYISYGSSNLSEDIHYNNLELADYIADARIAGKSLAEFPRFLADIDGDSKAELIFIKNPKNLLQPEIAIKKIK